MTQQISNPHDKLFKQLLGEPETAADFVTNNLPAQVVSHLDLKTLQVVQVSFIDTQFVQSEADLLFSVAIDGRPGYVYFLFEHQSSPDGFMMLRLLGYMVRVWRRFQGEHRQLDRLPVIVPMVLFHGPKGRQTPLSFQSLVDIPAESFVPYTPAFQCKLYDLSPFGQDQLAGNAVIRILADLLSAYGSADFQERVRRAFDTLNELLNAPGFGKLLEIVFRYVLQVFDIPKEELGQLVTSTLKRDVREFIMTTYEQLKQEGWQEGRQEGAGLVLARLVAKKFQTQPDELLPLLGKLSAAQQEELIQRILESSTLQDVTEWLESVCQN
ncbi:Rpn family recombination-promoting nuclease/putative transposase [Desulfoferrobacter suflitae]|uniref:Rpn family recombination-promoting nuclease/putative transposase n=1 Tax=Desulfoferrobacter suflitae TaxID=2865782 RepID=UPI0021649C8C|nr:Rpn family recombination-promoting nuclease/putative transposase [Desulfoferrobacter suflitae]MCK8603305.1 Rpn family recombination-promoting nuclease/putative transposase [Desulfoferrobacter suflitae]